MLAQPDYYFDKPRALQQIGKYRSRQVAESEVDTLLARLELDPQQWASLKDNPELNHLLVRYCMDFPLNIAWYENATRSMLLRQRVGVLLVLGIGILALLLIAAPTLLPTLGGRAIVDQTTPAAQIAVLTASFFGILHTVAAATDLKARIGGFWKAGSDLKEALFTFEENWRKKSLIFDGAVSADFITALYQELRFARKVGREERTTYFNTFKSPTDLVTVATSALDVVRGRRQELLSLQREETAGQRNKDEAATKRVGDLRDKLIEAKANLAAVQAKLEELKKLAKAGGIDASQVSAAEIAVANAKAEQVKTQSHLEMMVRSDALNL